MAEQFILQEIVNRALTEDLIYGDRTTDTLFPRPVLAVGRLVAKERLIVAGLDLFEMVFKLLDPSVRFEVFVESGNEAKAGTVLARLCGDGRALLKGERTALNFLQHLCGIATLTRHFVDQVKGTAKIVDTRKTLPGLRVLEKEAVLLGGGYNHRFHLGDLILIKDNHIALAGGILNAVSSTRATLSHPLKIEVEVNTLREVNEAIQSGAEVIMLDNMSLSEIEKAVPLIREKGPQTLIEVSGGVTLENVARVAQCGVDLISIGALTHSAKAADISLDITSDERNSSTKARHSKNRRRNQKASPRP